MTTSSRKGKPRMTKRKNKTTPMAAWDWRARRIPGAQFATLAVVEEAFIAGARWAERRSLGKSEVQK